MINRLFFNQFYKNFKDILLIGNPEYFLNGGYSIKYFLGSVLSQCYHPVLNGFVFNSIGIRCFEYQILYGLIYNQKLKNPCSSGVSCIQAGLTACSPVYFSVVKHFRGYAYFGQRLLIRMVLFPTVRADYPDQSLGKNGNNRRGYQKWFNAHINKPSYCTG